MLVATWACGSRTAASATRLWTRRPDGRTSVNLCRNALPVGTQRLVDTVLRENQRMLELARDLGFVIDPVQPDPTVRAIHLPLA
jgi:hypothetical protein